MTRLSRRTFLSLPAAAVLASCTRDMKTATPALARSAMGLFPARDYNADLSEIIFRGLTELRVDVRGKSVLLKPNMVEYESGHAINTHPLVVAAAADALYRAGAARVAVGEGPGHRRDIEYLLTSTGLFDHLRDARLRFVDLNHDDVRRVAVTAGFTGLAEISLPVSVLAADVIVSLPKLKTHHWAGLTCSMKNFFGVVPGAIYGWPKNILHIRGIDESILDLNATVRPHLTIVDAIVAMEGDGPIMGVARPMGFLAMGTDLPAVDATCARIIGLDPNKMPYLSRANGRLGVTDADQIEQRGEDPSRYRTVFDVTPERRSLRLGA
jgi:uncharacterized protein (DUF362 family)